MLLLGPGTLPQHLLHQRGSRGGHAHELSALDGGRVVLSQKLLARVLQALVGDSVRKEQDKAHVTGSHHF